MLENEEAKAVQEIAKVAGKGIDLVSNTGKGVARIFGGAVGHFAAVVEGEIAFWRYQNLLKISDKVSAIHKARKLAGKPIPLALEFALPILEAASIEVDDEVQTLWAGLLANATEPDKAFKIKKVFIETLRGMQSLDAVILQTLAICHAQDKYSVSNGNPLNADCITAQVNSSLIDVQISLYSLARLGCIQDSFAETIDGMGTGFPGFRVDDLQSSFTLSPYGKQLLSATSCA